MEIIPVTANSDNYMYIIIDELTKSCAAVDPVEPEKILSILKSRNLQLNLVLTTHHHWDHAGGNANLLKLLRPHDVPVYGGDQRVEAITHVVVHNEEIPFGNWKIRCLSTPCHTTGHVCYHIHNDEGQHSAVFTGDTLFIAGCGRFFEGSAEQMYHALVKVLATLPDDTEVYCGHEYTVKNLQFALTVEPHNANVKQKLAWASTARSNALPTVPSHIWEEKLFNPFMRVEDAAVLGHAKTTSPVEAMRVIRHEKDSF